MTQSRWREWLAWRQWCARLLFWAYFKPYTLTRYLHEIHQDLWPNINPFSLKAGFPDNPSLARYAWQTAYYRKDHAFTGSVVGR